MYLSWRCIRWPASSLPLPWPSGPSVDLSHPPSFLQLPAGDIRVKRLARPEIESPGDLFRSRRCSEGSIPYSKVRATGPVLQEGPRAEKKYHTHLLRPLLRTAVRALWGAYQCYNT